jgi:preprotein translocase subunit SecF
LIIAYVWYSFRKMSGPSAGVMALIALFHDILIAFFVFVVLRIPINESLVAVILSILGFSINDTIVIYDRIRENERLTSGKMPLADLVDLSINQSLARSINTSLCTFGAVAVAYVFAAIYNIESIKDFTLPMMIGLISGSYSTICLAGPLWVMWKTRKGRSGY